MSSVEDKVAAAEAELADCCRDISAELERVCVRSKTWK